MADKDTIIMVGVTELDGYNNLWVTPQGGGDKIKIGAKRKYLHPIFEQGKAVMLHWETYKDKTYVSDAKLVAGELPTLTKQTTILPEHQKVIEEARAEVSGKHPAPPGQQVGMWWKELGTRIGDGSLERDFPKSYVKIKAQYYHEMFKILRLKTDTEKPIQAVEEYNVTGEVTDAKSLMVWAQLHGKEYTPSWVRQQAGIDAKTIITDEMAVEAHNTIKGIMMW